MSGCDHASANLRKRCSSCDNVTEKFCDNFCGKCGERDNFEYSCSACTMPQASYPHSVANWSKQCSQCSEDAEDLSSTLCTSCGQECNFEIYCSCCQSGGLNPSAEIGQSQEFHFTSFDRRMRSGSRGGSSRKYQSMRQEGSGAPGQRGRWSRSNRTDAILENQGYHNALLDLENWIDLARRRFFKLLQMDSQEQQHQQQSSLSDEIEKYRAILNELHLMGMKLMLENSGNTELCADIAQQFQYVTAKFSSLDEHIQQIQENETRRVKRTLLTEDNPETSVEYFKIHDRVMRYAKQEHRVQITRIASIKRIENPLLDKRLQDVGELLHKKNCTPELLIHGTQRETAEKIIQEGFKVGTSGMFGAGIYFATDSTKSAQYCEELGIKSLLLCDVLLGKSMVCDAPKTELTLETVRAAGYDSVFARRNTKGTGGVLNDEYIIYRPEQATPRYLVQFDSGESSRNVNRMHAYAAIPTLMAASRKVAGQCVIS